MIERSGCRVIGVDISANMRALAASYVASDRFIACAPDGFSALIARGLRVDGAIAVWVLQHCPAPGADVGPIRAAMNPGAKLFVVNNQLSAVPTRKAAWVNDGAQIRTILSGSFSLEDEGVLEAEPVPPALSDVAFWAT